MYTNDKKREGEKEEKHIRVPLVGCLCSGVAEKPVTALLRTRHVGFEVSARRRVGLHFEHSLGVHDEESLFYFSALVLRFTVDTAY